MFKWLNGPGKALKDPLPSSTNYLSAYDRQGKLQRTKKPVENKAALEDPELDQDEESLQARDLDNGLSDKEAIKLSDERIKRRMERDDLKARDGITKERPTDLRPYPLNQNFVSQPVLSEDLREKIYELVVEDGLDMKAVSGAFGVDTRRVAAVVRLKTIERQWLSEVSSLFSSNPTRRVYMMIIFKNRLVLKTHTWLQNLALRASLITELQTRSTWRKATSRNRR